MARRVLVVAYYFPPLGGAGVQRTLKFVKYLPEFGWQPVVLTVKVKDADLSDACLEKEIPPGISIYRTSILRLPARLPWRLRNLLARWLLVVDEQVGWLPLAVGQARKIIAEDGVEAIYTTSAPYTAHLIGLRLKEQTGLPWVADFRDPWVGNFATPFPTPVHLRLAQRFERQISQRAERVTVVSDLMRPALLNRYHLPPERVCTLPNGYDPADFTGVEPLGQDPAWLIIAYTGSFYGRRQAGSFLQGLRAAIDDRAVLGHKVQVRFVGNIGQATQAQVEALGLRDVVQITGYLTHHQSIQYLLGADLLLLVVGAGPGSAAVLTGKIFEYLFAGKPILALAPPGAAADLVREAEAGVVVDPEDVSAIADQIAALYQKWERGELKIASRPEVVARYDRRRLTGQLAHILNEISHER
jgi:glycosyltransferase involved in cell wall biosynthesis